MRLFPAQNGVSGLGKGGIGLVLLTATGLPPLARENRERPHSGGAADRIAHILGRRQVGPADLRCGKRPLIRVASF